MKVKENNRKSDQCSLSGMEENNSNTECGTKGIRMCENVEHNDRFG